MRYVAILLLLAVSCAGREEQAIRHLVTAELIERERVTEDRIKIDSVEFTGDEQAVVEAKLSPEASRGARRTVHCTLRKEGQRWIVEKVEDQT